MSRILTIIETIPREPEFSDASRRDSIERFDEFAVLVDCAQVATFAAKAAWWAGQDIEGKRVVFYVKDIADAPSHTEREQAARFYGTRAPAVIRQLPEPPAFVDLETREHSPQPEAAPEAAPKRGRGRPKKVR